MFDNTLKTSKLNYFKISLEDFINTVPIESFLFNFASTPKTFMVYIK
jgi:hypothetical protein